jgi:proteasome lid subunit RPN8/RPN11
MPIHIKTHLLDAVKFEAEQSYPHECCGFLLGRVVGDERHIVDLAIARNARAGDDRKTRYLIPPELFLRCEREARAKGLDVIGLYHSHPDVAAQPSAYDIEHAWPWYSYLIVSVQQGRADHGRCWRLRDDRSQFDEEAIILTPDGR